MAYQYENVKLDKSMYRRAGASFAQVLEEQDPSMQYKGTELEGLDAFQRQLKRFDIKVKGPDSDCVEKFFAAADSAVLFPEYISRCVRQGVQEANVLSHLVGAVTHIDGMDYRSIAVENDENMELKPVGEGASIPGTTIRAQTNLVKLCKRGRMLVASYEAIRHQKLDLFSITLRQIGANIASMQLMDAVNVLINGDGNDNAIFAYSTEKEGVLTYADLVDLWTKMRPYEMSTMLVSENLMGQLLKLPELQNPAGGMNFAGTGKLVTPFGATLLCVGDMPAGRIIGLDKRYALELVECGDVCVEYDKLIDRQLERAAITVTCGFAKMFRDAGVMLEV